MHVRDAQSTVEAFLVLEQPRQRHSHWSGALARLDDRRAPPLVSVSAYYDPAADQALIGLRYDELVLGRDGLQFVVELALLEEIGLVQPSELTHADRQRFLAERILRCPVQASGLATVGDTLGELVRRIREFKASPRPMVVGAVPVRAASLPPPVPMPRPPPGRSTSRGDTGDPVLLVKAKGTRNEVTPPALQAVRARAEAEAQGADLARVERSPGRGGTLTPHVIPRGTRADTARVSPVEAYRRAHESMSGPLPEAGEPDRSATPAQGAFTATQAAPLPPGIIYARYLRSGRWVPIRIGALSLRGAALLTGALPRLRDHVDVALSFGGHRALVRGSVGKVSSEHEAALSGTSTFSVTFELDDASRRQLTSLLTAARAANVTIKPPPPRAARRLPVEWPIGLGTLRGVVRADALDVSRDGMFVRPIHALTLTSRATFSCVIDDGDPVTGRAQVVRQIGEEDAKLAAISAGYGLQILDMADVDRERWLAFVSRIERRAERCVLVGASPARLAEIQGALAAAGYAVSGGSDPAALVRLAGIDARPVDAALIDASMLAPTESPAFVESLFAARGIPCATHDGDPRLARRAIDRLLSVA